MFRVFPCDLVFPLFPDYVILFSCALLIISFVSYYLSPVFSWVPLSCIMFVCVDMFESSPGACTMMVDEQIQSYRISFKLTKPPTPIWLCWYHEADHQLSVNSGLILS